MEWNEAVEPREYPRRGYLNLFVESRAALDRASE